MANSNNNEHRHSTYEIPQNIGETGKVMDMIGYKNLLEGFIIIVAILIITTQILKLGILYVIFFCGLGAILAFVPYGANSDTLSTYIGLVTRNFFVRRTYRRYVRYRKSATRRNKANLIKNKREEELVMSSVKEGD